MIGGFFPSTTSIGTELASQDQKQQLNEKSIANDQKKSLVSDRSIRPVTVNQVKHACIPSENMYVIGNHEITSISLVGIVREILRSETHISFKIEDNTGSLDIKCWLELTSNPIGEMNRVVSALEPDDHVNVIGRLQQFNNYRSCIAIAVRKITDFNEVTYHNLYAIYTHLTIGKSLKFMLELNCDTNHEETNASRPRALPFSDNSHYIIRKAIHQCSDEELGAHVKAVVFHLRNVFAEAKVLEIIEALSFQGEIYNTNDDYIKLVDY